MKDEILDQIDKLKLMVMMDNSKPEKTTVEKYDEWVDVMMGRFRTYDPINPFHVTSPEQYAEYRTIETVVKDLYYQKYRDDWDYHKNKPEIQRIIATIVAMTIYIQGVKDNKSNS